MTTEAMRAAFEAWRETQPWYLVCKGGFSFALMNMAARSAWECATLMERERIKCWCETCRPITLGEDMRMVLCPTCGSKRCPRATDHRNACTGSNEPGQPGSSYENCKPFEAIRKGETP